MRFLLQLIVRLSFFFLMGAMLFSVYLSAVHLSICPSVHLTVIISALQLMNWINDVEITEAVISLRADVGFK